MITSISINTKFEKHGIHHVCGDYVVTPIPNAFNNKTSYWISKRNCTVAMYIFSANSEKEVNYQLDNAGGTYISLFEQHLARHNY